MKTKIAAVLSALLIGTTALCGCGQGSGNGGKPAGDKYDVLNLGEIAVGIYVTPSDAHREQKYFTWMSEAGINFVNGFRWSENTDDKIMQCLNFSEVAGLKFLVNDMKVLNNLETYIKTKNPLLIDQSMEQIKKYSDHNAYAGQFFIDEPFRSDLEGIADFTNMYDEQFAGNFWGVNMFSTQVEGLGCTYEDFMNAYFDLTNAKYYSFDCYPCLTDDGLLTDFFYSMDFIRSKTLARKLPYWAYIQAIGIGWANGEIYKRDPSENDIRWQVFMNLAFGAKGINYFTYDTPIGGAETFTEGMINPAGERTEHYYAAQGVNLEFKNYGNILLHSDAEGVIYNKLNASSGKYRLYDEPLTAYGHVTAVSGDKFVAGCFKHTSNGKKYMLIVPSLPNEGARAELAVSGLNTVNAYVGGELTEVAAENGKVIFDISAGNAVFIEI